MEYSELEFDIAQEQGAVWATVRFRAGEGCTDQVLARMVPLSFDFTLLQAWSFDIDSYGQHLTEMLFADQRMSAAWEHVQQYISYFDLGLRLYLRIDLQAPRLQAIRWESLKNPLSMRFLALDNRIQLSRLIDHNLYAPVRVPERGELRALIIAANPSDLHTYTLAPLDVDAQVSDICAALGPITPTILGGYSGSAPATAAAIWTELARGYHLIAIICHGSIVDQETYLWLETEHGCAAPMPVTRLLDYVATLPQCPLLMVLSMCQSGGNEGRADSLALGPALAAIGVPAVIAINGPILVSTVREMVTLFFRNLAHHGCVTRALSHARSIISLETRHAWWRPVLWTRLRDGRVWGPIAA